MRNIMSTDTVTSRECAGARSSSVGTLTCALQFISARRYASAGTEAMSILCLYVHIFF